MTPNCLDYILKAHLTKPEPNKENKPNNSQLVTLFFLVLVNQLCDKSQHQITLLLCLHAHHGLELLHLFLLLLLLTDHEFHQISFSFQLHPFYF